MSVTLKVTHENKKHRKDNVSTGKGERSQLPRGVTSGGFRGGGEVIECFQGFPWFLLAVGHRANHPHHHLIPSLRPHTHTHTQDQALLNYLGKCEGGALFLHLRAVGTFTALFQ